MEEDIGRGVVGEPPRNKHGHIHYGPRGPSGHDYSTGKPMRTPKPWSPEVYAERARRERTRHHQIRVALCVLGLLGLFALWALGAPVHK